MHTSKGSFIVQGTYLFPEYLGYTCKDVGSEGKDYFKYLTIHDKVICLKKCIELKKFLKIVQELKYQMIILIVNSELLVHVLALVLQVSIVQRDIHHYFFLFHSLNEKKLIQPISPLMVILFISII